MDRSLEKINSTAFWDEMERLSEDYHKGVVEGLNDARQLCKGYGETNGIFCLELLDDMEKYNDYLEKSYKRTRNILGRLAERYEQFD